MKSMDVLSSSVESCVPFVLGISVYGNAPAIVDVSLNSTTVTEKVEFSIILSGVSNRNLILLLYLLYAHSTLLELLRHVTSVTFPAMHFPRLMERLPA